MYANVGLYSNVSALKPPPLPRPRHKIPQMIPFSPGYSLTDKPPCYSSAPEINIANENNCTMFRIDGFSPRAPDQHINSAVKEKTKPSLVTDSVMSQQKYVPFLHCKSASLTELLPTNDLYDDLQPLPPKGNTVGTVRTGKLYSAAHMYKDKMHICYDSEVFLIIVFDFTQIAHIYDEIDDDDDDDDDGIYDDIDDDDDGIYDDIDDNDDDEGYVIKYLAKEHYLKRK